VFGTYEDVKRSQGRMDMEDVLLLTAGLLAEDERVAAQVRRQYKWFVVDEFQDVSPIQSALLDLWLGGRDEICVVGDPAQTIYSFAGARSDHLLGFPL
jgi:DNA helicase-2/ATP-dependent DNA helicase PcrA